MRPNFPFSILVINLLHLVSGSLSTDPQHPLNLGNGNSFGIPSNATFDYVVIGGGTAGNTIAARLAESNNTRVAVIEAGGFYQLEDGNRSVVPGYQFGNQVMRPSPLTDWNFETTPQAGKFGQVAPYARGKALGGSSALNYMAYHHGTIDSYQAWADALGDDSYTYDNLLPYFQKSVSFTPPNNQTRFANSTPEYDAEFFNNSLSGPLQLGYANWADPIQSWARPALEAVGIPYNHDGFCSGYLNGSNWIVNTVSPGIQQRSSSQTSFLAKAIELTDMKVYTHTLAKRILFDSNKTAIGVEVETGDYTYVVSAAKEVILSAGAFQSPQLLMVSGIGPNSTLSPLNITVISHLEGVGQNMQDHILFATTRAVSVETATLLEDPSSPYTSAATEAYLQNGTGPLTSTSSYLAWEKLPQKYRANLSATTRDALARFPADWPELEWLVVNQGFAVTPAGRSYASMANALVAPLSRGNVTINSTDAADPPIIDPNWLTDPADIDLAIQALKRQREVWRTKEMQGVVIGEEFLPGANITTDADIEEYIRRTGVQLYHASCTCKMGTADDEMAVVDSRARVFGVSGLRVVDASAFPMLPPGHPQSTVYMLAEKIADDIKSGR